MDKKSKDNPEVCKDWIGNHTNYICKGGHGGGNGMVYCLGVIGAAIYYFQHSVVTMDYVYGALKALVWPAYLIYKLFTMIGM
jgi:hypothetical protein